MGQVAAHFRSHYTVTHLAMLLVVPNRAPLTQHFINDYVRCNSSYIIHGTPPTSGFSLQASTSRSPACRPPCRYRLSGMMPRDPSEHLARKRKRPGSPLRRSHTRSPCRLWASWTETSGTDDRAQYHRDLLCADTKFRAAAIYPDDKSPLRRR